MNTIEILAELNQTLEDFTETLASFDEQEYNTVPYEGCWTPGQVAQHIILSVNFFTGLLAGPDTETERLPDMHVAVLKKIFLDFDTKLPSPEFIIPPLMDYNKQEQLDELERLKERLNEIIPNADMSLTCTGAQLPTMGHLTRTEIAHFLVYHTARHVHQLKKIMSYINSH
jgi:hypothetical protein